LHGFSPLLLPPPPRRHARLPRQPAIFSAPLRHTLLPALPPAPLFDFAALLLQISAITATICHTPLYFTAFSRRATPSDADAGYERRWLLSLMLMPAPGAEAAMR